MKKAVLIGVPHHNNLGDHAIVLAEREYIEDNFKEYQYYEVSEETAEKCLEKVEKHIHPEDILFLHGGGNLGDEYLYVEEARRKVVQLFPNNIIIFFPQTMHFSNTEKGKRELNKSREIYANHKKLVMVAREEVSYQTMKKEFYVTYLNKNGIDQKRDGALLILRSDIEANLDEQKIKQIEQTTRKYLKNVVYDDTAKGPGILSKYREEKIEEMLIKYRKCQLVITDRLHGMIFAAITSTPCIALGNYNHKIKSCSETLEHLGYIKYVDNVEEIEENIKYLMSNEFEKYDNKFAIEQFKQIKEEAIKLVK